MNKFSQIVLFILVNMLGFFSVPICYYIGVYSGALKISGLDMIKFNTNFLLGTYMTWAVCMIFSFAFFFLKRRERYFFLLAPVVIPVCYGLYAIFDLR